MPYTRVIPLADKNTNKHYYLYVKLPDDYAESPEKRYTVIYFTDAVWHMDILSAATAFVYKDVILVGISWQTNNSTELLTEYGEYASRFTDYSFWKQTNPNHPLLIFGGAKQHLDFIHGDVIPQIEKRFRTEPDKRTYFGYSLDGLFGVYILVNQPEIFKNYVIGSTSVELLLRSTATITADKLRLQQNVVYHP